MISPYAHKLFFPYHTPAFFFIRFAAASDLYAVGELLVARVNLNAGSLVELQLALGGFNGDGGLGFLFHLEGINHQLRTKPTSKSFPGSHKCCGYG